jgi:predicted RNA-binding protein YlqC (UPF0109 family)
MDSLLLYIVQRMVTHPDDVAVTPVESEDGQHLTLRLSVHQDDMGLVIGKDGNIARSLRNLLKVAAMKQHKRVYLDILEAATA